VLLLGAVLASGQEVPGQYIVSLSEPAKGTRSAQSRGVVRAALESKRVRVTTEFQHALNGFVVEAPDAATVASTPGVARVFPVRMYKLLMDRALLLHKVDGALPLIGGVENAGAGTKIAIIDTGVDVTHPSFNDAGFKAPNGFPRVNKDTDLRYTNNKVIVARNYDTSASASARDVKGHGTSVANVAAGVRNFGPRGATEGVAPRAYIGSYKVFPDNRDGAPNSQVIKAIDDAVADGMQVINLSLGSFPAESPENDPIVIAVENATRAGVLVVIAAGNSGPGLNTVESPATAGSAIAVGSSVNDRIFASSADVDGLGRLVGVGADMVLPNEAIRAPMVDVSTLDLTGLACEALPPGSLHGRVALVLRGTCYFEEKLNIVAAAGAVAAIIYTDVDRPEPISMSVGKAVLPSLMISHIDGLRARAHLNSGGNPEAAVHFNSATFVNPARLASFTSKGPTVNARMKPDLLAVGTAVYTAQPSAGGNPLWGTVQGTSFSAPIVAGAAALLASYKPGLTPEDYKSLLVNTSSAFRNEGGGAFALQQTGAGFLDVSAAVRSTVAAAPSSVEFGVGGGTADISRTVRVRNLGTAADTFSLEPIQQNGTATPVLSPALLELQPGASGEVTVRLQGANLARQAHEGFIEIRSTRTDVVARVPYWYGVAGGSAASITVVEAPNTGRAGSTQAFYVRVLDASGLPLSEAAKVDVIRGEGAQVRSVESAEDRYPGFYRVQVQLGPSAGDNVFEVVSGAARTQVTITGS
jgi:subtilisin family serine protease